MPAQASAGEGDERACRLLAHRELALCADLCAFSPVEPSLLAAGAYELDEAAARRDGLVYLFDTSRGTLEQLGEPTRCAGVFELVWGVGARQRTLLHAGADGSVNLLQLVEGGGSSADEELALRGEGGAAGATHAPTLRTAAAAAPDEERGFCLCAAWRSSERVAASFSNGRAALLQAREASLALELEWDAHTLFGAATEVWAVAQGAGEHLLWTGADDSCLKLWDARHSLSGGRPSLECKAEHGAGVCVVRPRPSEPHVVATGSYDEVTRLFDTRAAARGPLDAAAQGDVTGGGCWRMAWTDDGRSLAAACMQGGVRVYDVPEGELRLCERQAYRGHGSIAYGVDWRRDGRDNVLASCSFYDKDLHLWSLSEAARAPEPRG